MYNQIIYRVIHIASLRMQVNLHLIYGQTFIRTFKRGTVVQFWLNDIVFAFTGAESSR